MNRATIGVVMLAAGAMPWAAALAQLADKPAEKEVAAGISAKAGVPGSVAEVVKILDEVAGRGEDWTVLWGISSARERGSMGAQASSLLGVLNTLALNDDERAVVQGRLAALLAVSVESGQREERLREARALLQSVEGPPTGGEAARRVSLAAVLIAIGGVEEIREAEGLARSVLDLPRGDDAAREVPRGTHAEAMLALILTARGSGREPAAVAEIARGQFRGPRERLAIAEATARALSPGAGATREEWSAAIAPLQFIGGAALGELSAEQARELVDGKINELASREADVDRLPTAALMAGGDPARLMAAARREESEDVTLDALWKLADAHAKAQPPSRADEIEAVCRFIERSPKGRRAEEALRRATRRLEDWERSIMDGGWKRAKPPADVAPDDALMAIGASTWRVVAVLGPMGKTDSTRARLTQRAARLAIRAGKARGQWGDKALTVLREVWDDPAVTGETITLCRQWLEQRHPKKSEADPVKLAADLAALDELPTMMRQPYQLASWRVTLAEARARAGDHAGALATWDSLAEPLVASYVPGDLDRVLLGQAGELEALGRTDEALRTLGKIIGRFEQALAGQRPRAFWDAQVRTLRMQLARDRSAGTAASVRLRIRQLRATDATLGGEAWRESLEKLDAEAAGVR